MSYAVSRGHPAPLVGKRCLAGRLRACFCLDSCLVNINIAHTQDHDYGLYLCGGTSGIVWTARFSLLSSKKMEKPVCSKLLIHGPARLVTKY